MDRKVDMTIEDIAETVCLNPPYDALQLRRELSTLLRIIKEQDPKTILEIGTHRAGTAWAIQQAVPKAKLICMDNDVFDPSFSTADAILSLGVEAEYLNVDSKDPASVEKVRAITPSLDVLFIDGDHSVEGVRSDWTMYHELVAEGGIVVFHDLSPRFVDFGIIPLWEELKQQYRTQEIFEYPNNMEFSLGIGVLYK